MQDQTKNEAPVRTVPALSEQEQIRRAKLSELTEAGNSPYQITKYDVTHESSQILEGFESLEGQTVSIAGRMMSRRVMGKASFAHLLDGQGDIQIYVRRDDVGVDTYTAFKGYDIGDILGITGFVFKTQTGEISVHAQTVKLLSKCLKPLPEKFHGLQGKEQRYR